MEKVVFDITRELSCDVLVVGGGPSGLSAAVASARHGTKTILAERNGFYWPPQKPRKKSQDVHYSSKPEILGNRRSFECDYMRVPLAAAAVCAIVDAERYRGEILSTLRHYDYSTPNLSEFFHAAIAAAAMRSGSAVAK